MQALIALLATALAIALASGCTSPDRQEADNTGRNVRDREASSLTAQDSNLSAADVELTRQIRLAIVADDSLSVNAKNVKVITRNGHVTLRGAVSSQAEKRAIVATVRRIAPPQRVTDEIEVAM